MNNTVTKDYRVYTRKMRGFFFSLSLLQITVRQVQVMEIAEGGAGHWDPLKVHIYVLRFFGLWSYMDDTLWLKKVVFSIYGVIMSSLIWIFFGTLLADLLANSSELLVITDDGCFLAGISIILFKHIIFCLRREQIIKLIRDIHCPIDILAKSSDQGVLSIVRLSTLLDQLRSYGFVALGVILVLVLILVVPTENGSLPIRGKFPFNTTVNPMHNVAFVMQAGGVATAMAAIMGMDGMTNAFGRYLTVQMMILDSNYRHCETKWPWGQIYSVVQKCKDSEAEIQNFIPFSEEEIIDKSDSFVRRFKICIKHHQRLIGIVDRINAVFGSSFFFQLCASSSIICFAGFQAALGSIGSANLAKFSLYCCVAFAHLMSWCMLGNVILHQSLELADSQWQSGWENENYQSFAYLLIFAMIRGQQSLELKAIDFYTISMDTFIVIVKASYSIFALLATVTNEDPAV